MSLHTQSKRITDCEVCGKNEAVYTCPRCELRTCCLNCVKVHKKELECSGLRDKVKFKTIKSFDNIDLLNDYRLLEETARLVNKSVNLPPVSCYDQRSGNLPADLYRLRCTALNRGVQLNFLPPNFTRHIQNTSYLDHSTQNLFWRIDWVFVQSDNTVITDERVLDSTILSTCIHRYIEPEENAFQSLVFYQAAGHSGIKLLLKMEKATPDRYYLLDASATLRENLSGKSILEYPVVYVVLNNHIDMFNIVEEDEEEKNLRRRYRKRHHYNHQKPQLNGNDNFLFSNNASEENEVIDKLQISDDAVSFSNQRFHNDNRGRGGRRNFHRGQNRFNFNRNWRGQRFNRGQFRHKSPRFLH